MFLYFWQPFVFKDNSTFSTLSYISEGTKTLFLPYRISRIIEIFCFRHVGLVLLSKNILFDLSNTSDGVKSFILSRPTCRKVLNLLFSLV